MLDLTTLPIPTMVAPCFIKTLESLFSQQVMSYALQTSEHLIQSPDHIIPSEHTEIVEMLGCTKYVGLLMDIEDECLRTEAQILSLFLSLSVMEVHCREKKVCHLLDYFYTIFFKSNTVERPIITFKGAYTLQLLVHIWVRMTSEFGWFGWWKCGFQNLGEKQGNTFSLLEIASGTQPMSQSVLNHGGEVLLMTKNLHGPVHIYYRIMNFSYLLVSKQLSLSQSLKCVCGRQMQIPFCNQTNCENGLKHTLSQYYIRVEISH